MLWYGLLGYAPFLLTIVGSRQGSFARQAYASYFHLLMHLIYAFILLECRGEVRVLRRPTESMSKNKAWEEGASYILARGHPFTLSYIS